MVGWNPDDLSLCRFLSHSGFKKRENVLLRKPPISFSGHIREKKNPSKGLCEPESRAFRKKK